MSMRKDVRGSGKIYLTTQEIISYDVCPGATLEDINNIITILGINKEGRGYDPVPIREYYHSEYYRNQIVTV